MSIKHFHHVIICAAFLIALMFSGWCFFDPSVAGSTPYTWAGIGTLGLAVALIFYEIHYIKKTRKIYTH